MAALESFGEANLLRIQATGTWAPFAGLPSCGPDGLAGFNYPDSSLIVADCPVGALIGRIGGSSATVKAVGDAPPGQTKAFAVGSYCVVKLPEGVVGPLFIGFNGLLRPVMVEALTLALATARQ